MTDAIASKRRGCLLGGAIGDALGAPVEFDSLEEIRSRHGPAGITGPVARQITDDTQMTLFTAEGLIRANMRFHDRGLCHVPNVVWHAYQRWLATQGEAPSDPAVLDGWLITEPVLHARRAPGATCLSALRDGRMGSVEERLNDSKGCGGVMRVAPAGMIGWDPFRFGWELAALTHGHPSGYLAGGAFAVMIARLLEGATMPEAVRLGLEAVRAAPGSDEVVEALEQAIDLAPSSPATPEAVEELGAGWVAEEALAISVFCALTAADFASGVLAAVNHSGDSDSTGAITGNLLGALWGEEALPREWLEGLEAREIIEQLADDLGRVQTYSSVWPGVSGSPPEEFMKRYPGW